MTNRYFDFPASLSRFVRNTLARATDINARFDEVSVGLDTVQTEMDAKAPLNSPALTGTPTAPNAASVATDTTQIATTAWVQDVVDVERAAKAPINSPTFTGTPSAPNPLDVSVDTTQIATTAWVQDVVALKANVDNPAFNGTPTAPNPPSVTTDTTQIATTAWVQDVIGASTTLLPVQTGQSGKFLSTDGTSAGWVGAPGDVTLAGTQTLTNKTLTTPVLSGFPSSSTSGRLGYSSGEVTWGDGTAQQTVGFKNIPQNSRSAAYTLTLDDAGKHILHPSADTTARTFTIPANASVAFPIGTAVTFINQNAGGVITIAITTDTMRLTATGVTGSRTLGANGIATAVKIAATEWLISGSGLS